MILKYLFRALFTTVLTFLFLFFLYLPAQKWRFGKNENHLDLFIWADDLIKHASIREFEKKTGISVTMHFYSSNEELIVKLKHQGGKGYDILVPSDYAVKLLANEGYLKPLNKSKFNHWDSLDPLLLGHAYDPENRYSIPYAWETFGIVYNNELLSNPPKHTLAELFDPDLIDYKFVMTPDIIEAMTIASYYLFGDLHPLTPKEEKEVHHLLKNQKKWIEAYTDYRAKYFISTKNCPLALIRSSMLSQIAPDDADIEFAYPKEGIFTSIENMVITSTCQNEEAAYAFMNYFFEPKNFDAKFDSICMFPSNREILEHLPNPDKRYMKAYYDALERRDLLFFSYLTTPERARRIWVDTKS